MVFVVDGRGKHNNITRNEIIQSAFPFVLVEISALGSICSSLSLRSIAESAMLSAVLVVEAVAPAAAVILELE